MGDVRPRDDLRHGGRRDDRRQRLLRPGRRDHVAYTAVWLVPLAALAALALLRPGVGAPLLAALIGVVVIIDVVAWFPGVQPGLPITAVAAFVVGIALGFLGLRRPRIAGLLLAILAVLQYVTIMIGSAARDTGEPPRGGLQLLGGSSGAVVIPLLLLGVGFFVAGTLAHERLTLRP